MAKKAEDKTFKSFEEYRAYYSDSTKKKPVKGSKYYRIGADIAKIACDQAIHKVASDQAAASIHLS